MLKEKHISYIEKLVLEYKQDAETQFNLILQEDGIEDEEWKEEIETTTEILMALEAMREMDWTSPENRLRKENAILRNILGEVQKYSAQVVDSIQALRKEDGE